MNGLSDQTDPEFPLDLRLGSVWCWEPLKSDETCQVKVIATEWTGKEWYVEIEALEDAGHMWAGRRSSYELNWFVEASVLVRMPMGSRGRASADRR